jgi:hypothetical protein
MSQNQQRMPRRDSRTPADLRVPVRNHYFYGKLLDVHQLEMEQEYFNAKRRLLNRLVTGPGVVCGLRVELTADLKYVTVKSGLAIDRCGREIVVPDRSRPVSLLPLPPYVANQSEAGYQGREQTQPQQNGHEYRRQYHYREGFAYVVLCYHECQSDPVPAMAGDCDSIARCASGSIREQYRVEVRPGFAPPRQRVFPPNIVENGKIDYDNLVDYVMGDCRWLPDECCVPLANVELRDLNNAWRPVIDNAIRPIVYTNRLLFHLIESLVIGDEAEQPPEV